MKIMQKLFLLTAAVIYGCGLGIYRTFTFDPALTGKTYYILLGAGLVFFALAGIIIGRRPAPAVKKQDSTAFKTAIALSAVALFISSGFELYSLFSGTIDILLAATLALSVVSAFGILYTVASKDHATADVMSVIPVFFMGLFFLQMYKQYAASCPNRNIFATEIIAVAVVTLAAYSVCVMRFMGFSSSFLINFSIPGGVMLSAVIIVSKIITMPAGSLYVMDLPQIAVLLSISLYCGAWYLCPPAQSGCPQENGSQDDGTDDAPASPHFFDQESSENDVPDIDSIIEEVRSSDENC